MSEQNNAENSKESQINEQLADAPETTGVEHQTDENDTSASEKDEMPLNEIETLKKQLEEAQAQLEKEKKEYLFLMAEFDNFRKRTLKEKSEIIRNGAEAAMKGLLPVVDDFERGLAAINDSNDATHVKEGMELIYNKFVKYLQQNGVKEMDTEDVDFNADYHEAIAMVPVDDETHKGKVIDTVSKGYTINDKVLRHAKVAVGQ
jgi:molecular chaperone GrpE